MQEIFYEESVSMHVLKPTKIRYTLFTVSGILCVLFAAFAVLYIWLLFMMPVEEGTEIDVGAFWRSLIPWAVMIVVMIVGAVFFFRKRHSFYVSYDYTFVSGELRISKVLHERKRKLLYRLGEERIVKIGKVGSESYKKLKASPDIKEDILTPNEEAEEEKEFYYIQANTNVGKKILVLECRQQLIVHIVRFCSNKNILETEFYKK